jgi:hypothetical protein
MTTIPDPTTRRRLALSKVYNLLMRLGDEGIKKPTSGDLLAEGPEAGEQGEAQELRPQPLVYTQTPETGRGTGQS